MYENMFRILFTEQINDYVANNSAVFVAIPSTDTQTEVS